MTINAFGEADWELVLFVVLMPFALWFAARAIAEIVAKAVKEQ